MLWTNLRHFLTPLGHSLRTIVTEGNVLKLIVDPDDGLRPFETLVSTYKSTRRYNPEDQRRHLHCRENLKFCTETLRYELNS